MIRAYYFSTQGCALGASWLGLSLPEDAPFEAAAFLALRSKKLAITGLEMREVEYNVSNGTRYGKICD